MGLEFQVPDPLETLHVGSDTVISNHGDSVVGDVCDNGSGTSEEVYYDCISNRCVHDNGRVSEISLLHTTPYDADDESDWLESSLIDEVYGNVIHGTYDSDFSELSSMDATNNFDLPSLSLTDVTYLEPSDFILNTVRDNEDQLDDNLNNLDGSLLLSNGFGDEDLVTDLFEAFITLIFIVIAR